MDKRIANKQIGRFSDNTNSRFALLDIVLDRGSKYSIPFMAIKTKEDK